MEMEKLFTWSKFAINAQYCIILLGDIYLSMSLYTEHI